MRRKRITYALLAIALLSLCGSCAKDTEYYAKKESGKKCGIWEMKYYSELGYVYQPYMKLSSPVEGNCELITKDYDFWTEKITSIDTVYKKAFLKMEIYNNKSHSDATRSNYVLYLVSDEDGNYYPNQTYKMHFNEGKKDSLFFSVQKNSDGDFFSGKNTSKKLLEMLSKGKPVTLRAEIENNTMHYTYEFSIPISRGLDKQLEILEKRSDLADKEYEKILGGLLK